MPTAELLAIMTNKSVNYFGVGGIPQITPEIVAGACAGLQDGPYYLGMAKYAGDSTSYRDLEYSAWICAAQLAVKHGWAIQRGKAYLRGISLLACEHVVRHHQCKRCKGTGLNGQLGKCGRCGGHKLEPYLSERAKAKNAGIPYETFRTTWSQRYNILVNHIQGWESDLMERISRQLKGD